MSLPTTTSLKQQNKRKTRLLYASQICLLLSTSSFWIAHWITADRSTIYAKIDRAEYKQDYISKKISSLRNESDALFQTEGKAESTTDSDAQLASLSRQMEVLNADLEDILQSLKLLRVELTDARKMSLAEQAFRAMQIVLLVPALILMALSFQSPIGAADNSRKEMISHHELQSGHYHNIACSIFFPLFVFLLGAYWYFNNQSDDLTPEIRRMMVEIEYEEELDDINPKELKPKIERLQVLDQQYSHYENLQKCLMVGYLGQWSSIHVDHALPLETRFAVLESSLKNCFKSIGLNRHYTPDSEVSS